MVDVFLIDSQTDKNTIKSLIKNKVKTAKNASQAVQIAQQGATNIIIDERYN